MKILYKIASFDPDKNIPGDLSLSKYVEKDTKKVLRYNFVTDNVTVNINPKTPNFNEVGQVFDILKNINDPDKMMSTIDDINKLFFFDYYKHFKWVYNLKSDWFKKYDYLYRGNKAGLWDLKTENKEYADIE